MQQVATTDFAQIAAFYGDPLPFERRGRGYMETVIVAKIAALQAMLGTNSAIHFTGRVESAPVRKVAAKAKVARAVKKLTGEQFFDAYQVARKAVSAAIGERWVVLGHARWATIPAGWRSFTGPRGGKVKLPKDIRVPSAEYWPSGVLPDGLVLAEECGELTPWVQTVDRNGDTIEAHPMLVRAVAAHAEQNEANKPLAALRERSTYIRKAVMRHERALSPHAWPVRTHTVRLEQAAEIRLELAADLRRWRETGSFVEEVEEVDDDFADAA